VAVLPELDQISGDSYPFKAAHQKIKDVMTTENVPVLELIDGLKMAFDETDCEAMIAAAETLSNGFTSTIDNTETNGTTFFADDFNWTLVCGSNEAVLTAVSAPEPNTMPLIAIGFLALLWFAAKRAAAL
jgi:hypothetical protein